MQSFDSPLPLDILNGEYDFTQLLSGTSPVKLNPSVSTHICVAGASKYNVKSNQNQYHFLIKTSAPLLQCLPETLDGLYQRDVDSIIESLGHLPVGYTRKVSCLSNQYQWILPHQSHPNCSVECEFLLYRQLTMLLWEANRVATFLHVNKYDFDRSHRFIMKALSALFHCGNIHEGLAHFACPEHR